MKAASAFYRSILFVCLVFSSHLNSQVAFCGGFEHGVQGAETVARAGANVAKVWGPEALYLNVAGVGKGDGLRLVMDSNFVSAVIEADLYGNGADSWRIIYGNVVSEKDYVPVRNMSDVYVGDSKMSPAPYFGLTFQVPRFKRLSFGVGLFGPAALGDYQFPEAVTVPWPECEERAAGPCRMPSPQRYDLIYQRIIFLWPTVAAAFRISRCLTVGAGFQWGFVKIHFTQAVNHSFVGQPASYINDAVVTLKVGDFFVPAVLFGVQWNPIPRVELGGSVRFSGSIHAKGDVEVAANLWSTDPGDPPKPIYSNDPTLEWMDRPPYKRPTGGVSVDWPTVFRFGIRYYHPKINAQARGRSLFPFESELFDIEGGFFLEMNRVVDSMRVQVDGHIPIGRAEGAAVAFHPMREGIIYLRKNWRSNYSFRLGGSLNLLSGRLTLSGGGFYESPTTADQDIRLDYFTARRWGLSCGIIGRYIFSHGGRRRIALEASISYIHFFFPMVNVTDGRIEHISSLFERGTVINNGRYNFSLDILTGGLRITVL